MSLSVDYSGRLRFATDVTVEGHQLLVAIPCYVAGRAEMTHALMDCGSQWCVLSLTDARALGCDLAPDPWVPPMLTRFGRIHGRMERLVLQLPALEGYSLSIEATWFVSTDWPGPTVLGWRGGLERFRFAVDPYDNWFWFGEF